MSSEKTAFNPREQNYPDKEIMMARPGIVELVQKYEGSTFTANNISTQRYPNYRNNFVGKNLKMIEQMKAIGHLNPDNAQTNRYTLDEDLLNDINTDLYTELETVKDIYEEIYRGRTIDVIADLGLAADTALEELEQRGIFLRDCPENITQGNTDIPINKLDENPHMATLRPDYSEPTLELLSELSFIDRDRGRELTADIRDIERFFDQISDWREIADSLEAGRGLPNWAIKEKKNAKSYFREEN